ncbi:MAG: DUF2188 domain-containing protein [Bacilli bacterium]|nr:DUF2188 domain-containing protein [Bacilli bacterium]
MENKTKISTPKALKVITLVLAAIAILVGFGLTIADTVSGLEVIQKGFADTKSAEFMVAVGQMAKVAVYLVATIMLIVALAKRTVKGITSLAFSLGALLMVDVIASVATFSVATQGGATDFKDYLTKSRLLETDGFMLIWIVALVIMILLAIASGVKAKAKKAKAAMSIISMVAFLFGTSFCFIYLFGGIEKAAENAAYLSFFAKDLKEIITSGATKPWLCIGIMGYDIDFTFLAMLISVAAICCSKEVAATEEAPAAAMVEEKKEEPAPVEEEKTEEEVAAPAYEETVKEEAPVEEEKKEEPAAETVAPVEETVAEEPVKEEPAPVEEEKKEEPVAEVVAPVEEEKAEEAAPVEEAATEEPVAEEKEAKPAAKKAPAKKAPAKKAAAKPAAAAEETLKGKTYHVVKRAEDGVWSIKANKGQKALKLFKNKVEAMEYAKTLEAKGATILVHASKGAKAGKIQKR